MMLHINDCCNEVRQYVHMPMNILPARIEILWWVTMRKREQNANYDKITIVVIPTIVLIVFITSSIIFANQFLMLNYNKMRPMKLI